ncbi:hypothetical protein FQZ97_625450 [compost metagenome]
MMLESVCDKGSRTENLDSIFNFVCDGCWLGVLLVDGYESAEKDICELGKRFESVLMQHGKIDALQAVSLVDLEGLSVKASILLVVKQVDGVSIYHSGDCRAYTLEAGLLTEDHSVAWAQLVKRGICPSRVEVLVSKHPARRVLAKSFCLPAQENGGESLHVSSGESSKLLVCTDGYWEHFSGSVVSDILTGKISLKEFSERMPVSAENRSACILDIKQDSSS